MYRLTKPVLALSLLLIVSRVQSEGGTCPPGYYPHNTPGLMGCAPIPGYRSGNEMARTPIWGAIAIDPTRAEIGVSENEGTREEAVSNALKICLMYGTTKCKISIIYYDACGVVAWGDSSYATASSPQLSSARRIAISDCQQRTSNCRVLYEHCGIPQ